MLSLHKAFRIALIFKGDDYESFGASFQPNAKKQMISQVLNRKDKSQRIEKEIRSYTKKALHELVNTYNNQNINIDNLIL